MVGSYTLESKGKTGPVQVRTGGKEKCRITVQLTCMANGTKLPPFIIFKGDGYHWLPPYKRPGFKGGISKSARRAGPRKGTIWYEIVNNIPDATGNRYPPRSKCVIITQPKSNSNELCTTHYLKTIWKNRSSAGRQPKSMLVWDSFSAHGTDSVKGYLSDLNTISHVIDGGLTPKMQPLDKVVNKVFKIGEIGLYVANYDRFQLGVQTICARTLRYVYVHRAKRQKWQCDSTVTSTPRYLVCCILGPNLNEACHQVILIHWDNQALPVCKYWDR